MQGVYISPIADIVQAELAVVYEIDSVGSKREDVDVMYICAVVQFRRVIYILKHRGVTNVV